MHCSKLLAPDGDFVIIHAVQHAFEFVRYHQSTISRPVTYAISFPRWNFKHLPIESIHGLFIAFAVTPQGPNQVLFVLPCLPSMPLIVRETNAPYKQINVYFPAE
jgi:hypothetical protein